MLFLVKPCVRLKASARSASSSSEVVEEQVVADEASDVSLSDDVHPNIEE